MIEQVVTFILKDGTPTGIIECAVDEWYGISYKIPRYKLKDASNLKCINNTGLYILFGNEVGTDKKIAYIGETENVLKRLNSHNKKKDYWNECIVFISENNSLNKAHFKYIEHELYVLAEKVNRYIIKNDATPNKSSLSTSDEIKSKKFIERIKTITSMMGFKLFIELIDTTKEEEKDVLFIKNNGIEYAKGILTDEGFVILKGSKIKEMSPTLSKSLVKCCTRERNSEDVENGIFINNHLCSSPSMAAVIILGRNSNGYTEWKNKNGVTLGKILGR